jgi:hypothetical protein
MPAFAGMTVSGETERCGGVAAGATKHAPTRLEPRGYGGFVTGWRANYRPRHGGRGDASCLVRRTRAVIPAKAGIYTPAYCFGGEVVSVLMLHPRRAIDACVRRHDGFWRNRMVRGRGGWSHKACPRAAGAARGRGICNGLKGELQTPARGPGWRELSSSAHPRRHSCESRNLYTSLSLWGWSG